ncbi:beta-lactamase-like protein [Candidatus Koribacter versatilis Ellin345]|uniref:Beta-lactamase-like protein n=1 Tax=Koribacter versatilis (strain Ellin345) TaxID=204669 RepID=Q1IUU2_KORVE|nr:MBL fold metallo-hydrolase [Candidatus Koribacter versatilis]ABF39358.1 beta-lactamase-like protein [Candidatus Koribacter versatilis Ellin345]
MRNWLLCGVGVLSLAAFGVAQDNDFSKVQIKVEKVAGSVYMLQGAGGNIGVSIGDDGIVIVDDQFAPLADKIRAALKGITDKPVRFVINTHYHGDHTGGNLAFQKEAPIIAQDNVRKRLEEGGVGGVGAMKNEHKPVEPGALPILTFDHQMTVHLNGEDIRALHVPSGHTDGDSVIFFPKSNVVHMGDDFVTYGFPFVDINSGGSVRGMIDAIDKVLSQVPPDAKFIPGHGPLSTSKEVRDFQQMLKETLAAVQDAMSKGLTLDQMKQQKILEKWSSFDGKDKFIHADTWIETIYDDLSGKSGEFVKHN